MTSSYQVNTGMLAYLALDCFPDCVTIKSPGTAVKSSGQHDPTPVAVAGMSDVPARRSPLILSRPTSDRDRSVSRVAGLEQWHLVMLGRHDGIEQGWTASVTAPSKNGTTKDYEIESSEVAPNGLITRLRLKNWNL